MPLEYYEAFGYTPDSKYAGTAFRLKKCPFVDEVCSKSFANGVISGSCTLVNPTNQEPVPCCPKRLYGDDFKILSDVVEQSWGAGIPLVLGGQDVPAAGRFVIPFGQRQGHEIRIPHKALEGSSKFSIDWMLALVDEQRNLEGFVAVEVQTIDTTGNYRNQFWQLAKKFDAEVAESIEPKKSSSNFNFENVNKRIIPQLITKGHILRREKLCTRGLFFICPTAVYERIRQRVGDLDDYPIQTGSITFLAYSIDQNSVAEPKKLKLDSCSTTTSEQLSVAFSSPKNLPPKGVYEEAIRKALADRFAK